MELITVIDLCAKNITLLIACLYFLVSLVFYANRNLEVKLLNIHLDPKKGSRGRKQINDAISTAKKEKKMAFFWPIILLNNLVLYVKSKLKKE
tara:strand:+ start:261 stop:539 length:279 start_codon:yes stop_codon:yes gene_type:complete